MAYDKTQAQTLGEVIVGMVEAVRDGLQPEDASAGIALMTAFSNAADEIKDDRDAAILDIVSGATSAAADLRRDPEV